MKTKTKILYISLWVASLLFGSFLFALPTITNTDILTTSISSLEHKGIYLTSTFLLDSFTVLPGDRIIRINDCSIEDHLEAKCEPAKQTGRYSYEIIRDGQSFEFTTTSSPTIVPRLIEHLAPITGAVVMLICGLLILLNISKVRWFPNLLILSLLFSLIFIFESIQLPTTWFLLPQIFWGYHAIRLATHAVVYAAGINLVLVYPQQRFNRKRTRKVILGVNIVLPCIAAIFITVYNSDLLTGLRVANQWFNGYSILILLAFGFTVLYHIRKSNRPIVNLRIRWIRIGAIAVFLMVASIFSALMVSPIDIDIESLLVNLEPLLKTFSHPFTLLIVLIPFLYAIPLSERFPRKIDNLENRVLFYLLLGTVLSAVYFVAILIIFKFNFAQITNTPSVYIGFGLTITVMVVLALLRSPVDLYLNRWFYRDRLKYQTLIPGFLLELSSNLNYDELIHLLLVKLPENFQITAANLILQDLGGESYSQVNMGIDDPPAIFSPNHPLIQFFHRNNKPILRYLDTKTLHPGINAIMEKSALEAAIPLTHLGNLVGIYFLQKKKNGKPYSISELNVLSELNQWAGTAIYNTRVISKKEDYSRSLEIEMAQQSRELNRVVDETIQYRRSNKALSVQQESILSQVEKDLNDPMKDILSMSQELAIAKFNGSGSSIQTLQDTANRLSRRLNTFLEYSTLQTDNYKPNADRCELSVLFDSILNSLEQEIPQIKELVNFHLDAETPMLVVLDIEKTKELLLLLIRISLHIFPDHAYVITCRQQLVENSIDNQSQSLVFQCDYHDEAILLEKTEVQADQIPLNIELAQLLCHRLGGKLYRIPLEGDATIPFQFSLRITIPPGSFPAFMGVDLPYLIGKSLIIFECDPVSLKKMTLQATSWGMKVSAVSNKRQLKEAMSDGEIPDLIIANAECSSDEEAHQQEGYDLPPSIKTILYQTTSDQQDSESSPSAQIKPAQMYNLLSQALLFSTTTHQYPHIPKELQLEPEATIKSRSVLLVGEEENRSTLTHYFSRFNLQTFQYAGKLMDLPTHLQQNDVDILILELSSDDQSEWEIMTHIRGADQSKPFIIALSANEIRFPALTTLKSGANKYLLKPYSLEELLLLIAEWLNQSVQSADGL